MLRVQCLVFSVEGRWDLIDDACEADVGEHFGAVRLAREPLGPLRKGLAGRAEVGHPRVRATHDLQREVGFLRDRGVPQKLRLRRRGPVGTAAACGGPCAAARGFVRGGCGPPRTARGEGGRVPRDTCRDPSTQTSRLCPGCLRPLRARRRAPTRRWTPRVAGPAPTAAKTAPSARVADFGVTARGAKRRAGRAGGNHLFQGCEDGPGVCFGEVFALPPFNHGASQQDQPDLDENCVVRRH